MHWFFLFGESELLKSSSHKFWILYCVVFLIYISLPAKQENDVKIQMIPEKMTYKLRILRKNIIEKHKLQNYPHEAFVS